jgi:GNAT superfamily N-acetyltransferase
MEDHAASHVPFLALRNGGAIGMAWLALVDRVPGPEHFTRRSAYVQSVFVISPERSNGIATSLMELVLAYARDLFLDYVAVHPASGHSRFTDASGSRTLTVCWSFGFSVYRAIR